MSSEINLKGKMLKRASAKMVLLTTEQKNDALLKIANALEDRAEEIIVCNELDIQNGRNSGMSESLIDRLSLDKDRIKGIADAVRELVNLDDPIGEVMETFETPNKMKISKVRVPMGVIGMIYEARPNVTVDAATIAIKTGNAIMLRGSASAINSNECLVKIIHETLRETAVPEETVQLICDTSRDSVGDMLKSREFLDLLIPRGSASLINLVTENSTVPYIETGVGNCHVYIDESADVDMAVKLTVNSKTQRPSVCNSAEKLLIHKKFAEKHGAKVLDALREKNVELVGCEKTREIYSGIALADEKDWETEYLELKMAVKVVDDVFGAAEHIAKYGTKHTETIISEHLENVNIFRNIVDAAAINHNVSSRMTDGGVYGFGAEIGISTQKLHARGPMGLKELTSYKYFVEGNGQIR